MTLSFTPFETTILKRISTSAKDCGVEAYLIGGFVRDKLLNRECKDIDVVCLGDGIELAHHVASQLSPSPKVSFFKNFGTAHIRVEDMDIEFVGSRKESYQRNSRKPEVTEGSLQDDQNRRDLTINALAINLDPDGFGTILDPFNGLEDLQNGILKTPLQPESTFDDDPLRMMRVIRFASQLHFKIEEKTLKGIAIMAPRIHIVSLERVMDEFNKIMMSAKPSIGLELLFRTKLLHSFFKELSDLSGAEYLEGVGHKDNFFHTIQVVDQIAPYTNNLWLRWAALLHDIGKPATKRFEEGHGWTFHGHEWIGSKMVPAIFKKLKMPLHDKMRYVQKIVQLHHRPVSLTKEEITDSAIRRLLFDAGEELEDLMTLCKADITSKNAAKVKRFRENFDLVALRLKEVEESDKIRNWQPPITGEIIMETFQLSPCKTVGIIKDAVREAILDGIVKNDFEAAFEYMLIKAKELHLQPVKK